jgi:hypothetical protein
MTGRHLRIAHRRGAAIHGERCGEVFSCAMRVRDPAQHLCEHGALAEPALDDASGVLVRLRRLGQLAALAVGLADVHQRARQIRMVWTDELGALRDGLLELDDRLVALAERIEQRAARERDLRFVVEQRGWQPLRIRPADRLGRLIEEC